MLSEMGLIEQDGFSPVFDLCISKQITSQVALSTNFTLGSANLINSAEEELGSVNFSTWSANLLYHIIQLEKTAFYLKGGVGLLAYNGKDPGLAIGTSEPRATSDYCQSGRRARVFR